MCLAWTLRKGARRCELHGCLRSSETEARDLMVASTSTQSIGVTGGGKELKMTYRQMALIEVIQSLDPERRHTLTIVCRGTEPWKLEKISEHMDIELRPDEPKG